MNKRADPFASCQPVTEQEAEWRNQWAIFTAEGGRKAPQGPGLELALFDLLINNLELGVSSEAAKFADATELFGVETMKAVVKCSRRTSTDSQSGQAK